MVFNKLEWKAILDAHPWKDIANADPSKSIVTLMPEALETLSIDELIPYAKSDDLIYHHPPALYLYLPEGMGKSKLDNKRMEKWSGVNCTGRNWRSMNALLKLSEEKFSV